MHSLKQLLELAREDKKCRAELQQSIKDQQEEMVELYKVVCRWVITNNYLLIGKQSASSEITKVSTSSPGVGAGV